MSETVEQLVTELVAAWNTRDVQRVVPFYAPDYEGVDVGEAAPQRGQAGISNTLARYLQAFPDLHFTEEEVVVQGNRVALAWTARGTHRGPLMNIPPTGRQVAIRGVSLLTLEGDRVRRAVYIWDVAGFLRAIGLLPELQAATNNVGTFARVKV